MNDLIHALAHVQKEIDTLRREQVMFLAEYCAKNFDEYAKICGVIRGLSLADSIINDLVQRINKDD